MLTIRSMKCVTFSSANSFLLATVITPISKEAEILTGLSVKSKSEMKRSSQTFCMILEQKNVVIKGGNRFDQKQAIDLAYDGKAFY